MTDNNKNLYNGGSEWQNDYGNLPDLQQTFYRNYDAALGRWIAVDPVAESAESMTVYQYAGNNPVMMNDPLGDKVLPPGEEPIPNYYKGPHHSSFGSGIPSDILSLGEDPLATGGNSSAWNSILANTGYYVLPNGKVVLQGGAQATGVIYTFDTDGKLYSTVSNGEYYNEYEQFVASANGGFREKLSAKAGLALLNQPLESIHVDLPNGGGSESAFVGGALLSSGWVADGVDPEPVTKIGGAIVMVGVTLGILYENRTYLANSAVSLYHKMTAEIDRIAQKAKGPQGFTYALVARYSGPYPNVRGGTTFLNVGDVWKIRTNDIRQ